MSVTPSSNIVGVFTDRASAEQAIEALYNAGFMRESIRYSVPDNSGDGTFLGGLKNLFGGTGSQSQASSLANDLGDMGLSNDEVQYYTNEYTGGHTILAVSAPDRTQDVLSIFHQYGAYGTGASGPLGADARPAEQNETFDNTAAQAQNDPYQHQDPDTSHTFENDQRDTTAPEEQAAQPAADDQEARQSATGYQEHQPTDQAEVSEVAVPEQQSEADDQVATDTDQQAARTDTSAPDQQATQYDAPDQDQQTSASTFDPSDQYTAENQTTQHPASTSPYQTDELNAVPPSTRQRGDQDSRAGTFTPEYSTGEQVDGFAPQTQTDTATPTYSDKLQEFHQQLEEAQQQLEEAQSQLQAAREHEGQLQVAKQRLQELQTKLQAAQAELHETRTRIAQY